MTESRIYILPDAEDTELRISRSGALILLHHNGGTKSFSIPQATSIKTALMAVLSGEFDCALTETELRLRAEREARREAAAQGRPAPPASPTLESL